MIMKVFVAVCFGSNKKNARKEYLSILETEKMYEMKNEMLPFPRSDPIQEIWVLLNHRPWISISMGAIFKNLNAHGRT